MPRFVQRLCDSGTWEDAWRFSLAKVPLGVDAVEVDGCFFGHNPKEWDKKDTDRVPKVYTKQCITYKCILIFDLCIYMYLCI